MNRTATVTLRWVLGVIALSMCVGFCIATLVEQLLR